MTYEGGNKSLPILGIQRYMEDNLCNDGAMNEVVGMEYKNGSYVPYSGKSTTVISPDYAIAKIYVHKTSDGDKEIHISTDGYVYYVDGTSSKLLIDEQAVDVKFVGNVICISTEDGIKYKIFKDGDYQNYGSRNVDNNLVHFRTMKGLYTKGQLYAGTYSYVSPNEYSYDNFVSQCQVAKGFATQNGGLTGAFLLCFGWRLNNGEIVNVSPYQLFSYPYSKYKPNKAVALIGDKWTHEPVEVDVVGSESLASDGYVSYIYDTEFAVNKNGFIRSNNDGDTLFGSVGRTYLMGKMPFDTPVRLTAANWAKYKNFIEGETPTAVSNCLTNRLQIKIDDFAMPNDSEISSLCVFISKEVSQFSGLDFDEQFNKTSAYGYSPDSPNDYEAENPDTWNYIQDHAHIVYESLYPKTKSESEMVKEIRGIQTLHLVEEIPVSDFGDYSDWTNIDLTGKLGDNLVVREALKISSLTNYDYINGKLFADNSLLHTFGFSQRLQNASALEQNLYEQAVESKHIEPTYITIGAQDEAFWEIDVKIKDESGQILTLVSHNSFPAGQTQIPISLNPYVNYVDYRAFEMTVRVLIKKNGVQPASFDYYKTTFPLSQNRYLNCAVSINGIEPIVLEKQTGRFPTDFHFPIETNEDTIDTQNKLVYSDTLYPSYFPASHTELLGNGKIIGLATLNISLSQDTFGKYPVLVFCTDGIYSLQVDVTGTKIYNGKAPFSREVCVNPKTICSIDGAVLFASSKGLMIASAQGVQEFCPHLNGMPKNTPMPNYDKGNGMWLYKQMVGTLGVTEMEDTISNDDFIKFLTDEDTVVSYVSNKNKAIVYNKNYDYSYWIDLQTRNTTKLGIKICFDDDNYPTEAYYDDISKDEDIRYEKKVFEYEMSDSTGINTLIQSRPIKIAGSLKSFFRVILRGMFRNDDRYGAVEKDYFGELAVLGSLDGEHWKIIGFHEKSLRGGFHDFGCLVERVSVNYIMIIFSGALNKDSHIDAIELTAVSKYNNKLK